MKKSEWMKKKHAALRKVADEAERNFMKAEDVLTQLEDREARRAHRSAASDNVPAALAARMEGRD